MSVGIYSEVVPACMAITYSIWEVDNCTSNPALALNERTAENLGGKEVVINCLHIKGSWTGLLMNHHPADVHKRFSVSIYIRWRIRCIRGNTAVYMLLLLLLMLTSRTQSVEEGVALLQLYKYATLLLPYFVYCFIILLLYY